jgi:hypothetical protein
MKHDKEPVVQCMDCLKIKQDNNWIKEDSWIIEASHSLCDECLEIRTN